jgi:hypothetical protein
VVQGEPRSPAFPSLTRVHINCALNSVAKGVQWRETAFNKKNSAKNRAISRYYVIYNICATKIKDGISRKQT